MVVGGVYLYREPVQVGQGPGALGVQLGVQGGPVWGEELLRLEVVEPQQPVRLVQPVLPEQGRPEGLGGGEQRVCPHRDVGGEEHPLKAVLPVHPLGEFQDLVVALPGGPHDHLGGLARRGKGRGVAEPLPLGLGLADAVPDLGHGLEDVLGPLVRGQESQAPGGGELDVHRQPVGQPPQLGGEEGIGPGDGLGVDVPGKAVVRPEEGEGPDQQFRGVVWAAHHGGTEEEPFDVVAPVEVDGEVGQLPGGEHGPGQVVGGAVDAVLAVVNAHVGQEQLQQGDAPPIRREGVAAARGEGLAQAPAPAIPAAGGAGHVIFGGVGEDGEFFFHSHGNPSNRNRTYVLL